MSRSLGIPVKLLHKASGHVVTVKLKRGELYRGNMIECEDNWNCQLGSITYTTKVCDHTRHAEECSYVKRLDARIKGRGASLGVGRGRAAAMRANAQDVGHRAAPGRGVPPMRR